MTTTRNSVAGVVLFHGAGSNANHSCLVAIEEALAPLPVFRINFPYRRREGRRPPDRTPVLFACVREEVSRCAKDLGVETGSLVIGGRSMGGRICSMVVADMDDPLDVGGLVLVSYPLHPPLKPEKLRTEHLSRLSTPTLCISGTKDAFGTPDELVSAFSVSAAAVEWRWIEKGRHELSGADHVVAEIISAWVGNLPVPH